MHSVILSDVTRTSPSRQFRWAWTSNNPPRPLPAPARRPGKGTTISAYHRRERGGLFDFEAGRPLSSWSCYAESGRWGSNQAEVWCRPSSCSTRIGAKRAAQWLHRAPNLVSATSNSDLHPWSVLPQIVEGPGSTSLRTVGVPMASVIVFFLVRQALMEECLEGHQVPDNLDDQCEAGIGAVVLDALQCRSTNTQSLGQFHLRDAEPFSVTRNPASTDLRPRHYSATAGAGRRSRRCHRLRSSTAGSIFAALSCSGSSWGSRSAASSSAAARRAVA